VADITVQLSLTKIPQFFENLPNIYIFFFLNLKSFLELVLIDLSSLDKKGS
jgi:hypothetical protein